MELSGKDAARLAEWYEANKRPLPWRDTGDPYHVWISEIMLQQTRIEAVVQKYTVFVRELPDIVSLAQCSDEKLMRLWEGMGYYSRARNLKKCAQTVMESYGGQLPGTYDALLKLPGIGPYTAGAIASIAFGEPVPAADGNVLRILARFFLTEEDVRSVRTKALLTEALKSAYGGVSPSSLNQGLMELGQTVCTAQGAPGCGQCPLRENCQAFAQGRTGDIPYRSKDRKRRKEAKTLLILRDSTHFVLRKRPETGLLAGLYEFPSVPGHIAEDTVEEVLKQYRLRAVRITPLPDARHLFSHIEWDMKAYEIRTADLFLGEYPAHCRIVTKEETASMAIPSAFRTYIDWYHLRNY